MIEPPKPPEYVIASALKAAAMSMCRSKRGVVLYDPANGAHRGAGHNGPPGDACHGREICAGKCGKISVHAEVRALREAAVYIVMRHPPGPYDLVHVELAADGGVAACDGPSCLPCSVQILDVGFVGGVWLYETMRVNAMSGELTDRDDPKGYIDSRSATWRRYTAAEFHRATMERCGMVTPC